MLSKVIDSSEVTVKTEISLPEQVPVLRMNTEVKDSTQVAINTCIATMPKNNSFQKQSVDVLMLIMTIKMSKQRSYGKDLESCHLRGLKK